MSTYIIAIGGTGAKFVEAIVHLSAAGIYLNYSGDRKNPETIKIIFLDPDKGNGHIASSDKTLKIYQKCTKIIGKDITLPIMQSRIEQFKEGLWSPFVKARVRLRDAFKYDEYRDDNPVRHLFEVLYTAEERDDDLREGFHGRPAVGAAIMTQLSQDENNRENWQELIDQIKDDRANTPKVFLCGSIFGGTGASGFPTLGQLLLKQLKDFRSQIKLGGVLMLPYFRFRSPRQSDKSQYSHHKEQKIYARSEDFILNTEAALRYYATKDLKFNRVYLLGTPELTEVSNFSTGGSNQRNPPHFLELYAALALRDFLQLENNDQQNRVVLTSRHQSNATIWNDIPDRDEVRKKLTNAARFAFAWNYAIAPDLKYARDSKRPNAVPWSLKFLNRTELESLEEQDRLKEIQDWCQDYLLWLAAIHWSETGVELFNPHSFLENWPNKEDRNELNLKPYSKEVRDEFTNLLNNSNSTSIYQILEKLPRTAREIQLPNRGVVGLVKALYRTIEQNP
ncbi:MAG: hypothetical protein AAGA60_26450 [Cyanobacteria bacterium P01_E01_bin.42]